MPEHIIIVGICLSHHRCLSNPDRLFIGNLRLPMAWWEPGAKTLEGWGEEIKKGIKSVDGYGGQQLTMEQFVATDAEELGM